MDDNKKPLVLVTNDDGIDSPGLLALAGAVQPFCDLLIVAPVDQQTNMGRGGLKGIDIGIIEKRILNIGNKKVLGYAVNGSPAQAVAHAVLEIADRKPDFCLSGINYGENLGLAFTCSGTLGAAFEADSLGIPSIAFSRSMPLEVQKSSDFSRIDWTMEQYHVAEILKEVLGRGFADSVRILNVNFPKDMSVSTEVRITRQAYMNYGRYVHPGVRDFNKGQSLNWALNEHLGSAESDTDIYAMHIDCVISVTPMSSMMSLPVQSYLSK